MIDDKHQFLTFLLWLLAAVTLIFALHEVGVYAPPLIDHLAKAIVFVIDGVTESFGRLAAGVGVAFAEGIAAALGVPVGVLSITILYRFTAKTEKTRRAWLVALGMFLYPVFVDFFEDALPEKLLSDGGAGIPGAKIVIAILFATIFLLATVLSEKSSRLGKFAAGALYLTPVLVMFGYLLRYQKPADIHAFFAQLTAVEWLGLFGLVLTAGFGIYLSRTESVQG
jgi:hypothetical protein